MIIPQCPATTLSYNYDFMQLLKNSSAENDIMRIMSIKGQITTKDAMNGVYPKFAIKNHEVRTINDKEFVLEAGEILVEFPYITDGILITRTSEGGIAAWANAWDEDALVFTIHIGDSETFTLPLTGVGEIEVDWGDGDVETFTTDSPTHVYGEENDYIITVTGTATGVEGDWTPHLRGVSSWGNLGLTSFEAAFRNSEILEWLPLAWPTGITDLGGMFAGTESDTYFDLSNLDTSQVTTINGLLATAKFTGNLSNWDLSSETEAIGTHTFVGASTVDIDVSNWDLSAHTDISNLFNGNSSGYIRGLGTWYVGHITDMNNVFYSAQPEKFQIMDLGTWVVSSVENADKIFAGPGMVVTGGNPGWEFNSLEELNENLIGEGTTLDGDFSEWKFPSLTDTADALFGYQSSLSGDFSDWKIEVSNNFQNITSPGVELSGNFSGWEVNVAGDTTDRLFYYDNVLDGDFSDWEITSGGDLSTLTYRSELLGDFSSWRLVAGNNLQGLAAESSWEGNFRNWSVHAGSTTSSLLAYATLVGNFNNWEINIKELNGPLLGDEVSLGQTAKEWEVSIEDPYAAVFIANASLEGNFDNWVIDFQGGASTLFSGNNAVFNGSFKNWSISGLNEVIFGTVTLEGDFSGWELLDYNFDGPMFNDTTINGRFYDWELPSLATGTALFVSSTFGPNFKADGWSLPAVTTLAYAFSGTTMGGQSTSFIEGFVTDNVTDMSSTFSGSDFNGDLSGWNFENVTTMQDFATGNTEFSTENYGVLLEALASQDVNDNVQLDVEATYPESALEARNILIGKGWTINDGGVE